MNNCRKIPIAGILILTPRRSAEASREGQAGKFQDLRAIHHDKKRENPDGYPPSGR
jgi:hypothetical protein